MPTRHVIIYIYSLLLTLQPLIIALNKMDVAGVDSLAPEYTARLDVLRAEGVHVMSMSTLKELNVDEVRNEVTRYRHGLMSGM